MHTSLCKLALGLLVGLDAVAALPAPAPARGNNQLAQILEGTGIQALTITQLNTLLRNLQARGVTLGCEAETGAGAGEENNQNNGEADAGEEQAGGEAGEDEGNEVNLTGEFDVPVAVEGGEIKQDILFTASTVGSFEFEFQGAEADEITVSENTAPAAAPAGFEAIEPNSFKVSLAQSKGVGLTLSKIDFIFDTANAALEGKDVTTAQVGRLCETTGDFIISESLGELEFELEENEVTLNLNKNVTAEGEWGIFLPVADAAAATKVQA